MNIMSRGVPSASQYGTTMEPSREFSPKIKEEPDDDVYMIDSPLKGLGGSINTAICFDSSDDEEASSKPVARSKSTQNTSCEAEPIKMSLSAGAAGGSKSTLDVCNDEDDDDDLFKALDNAAAHLGNGPRPRGSKQEPEDDMELDDGDNEYDHGGAVHSHEEGTSTTIDASGQKADFPSAALSPQVGSVITGYDNLDVEAGKAIGNPADTSIATKIQTPGLKDELSALNTPKFDSNSGLGDVLHVEEDDLLADLQNMGSPNSDTPPAGPTSVDIIESHISSHAVEPQGLPGTAESDSLFIGENEVVSPPSPGASGRTAFQRRMAARVKAAQARARATLQEKALGVGTPSRPANMEPTAKDIAVAEVAANADLAVEEQEFNNAKMLFEQKKASNNVGFLDEIYFERAQKKYKDACNRHTMRDLSDLSKSGGDDEGVPASRAAMNAIRKRRFQPDEEPDDHDEDESIPPWIVADDSDQDERRRKTSKCPKKAKLSNDDPSEGVPRDPKPKKPKAAKGLSTHKKGKGAKGSKKTSEKKKKQPKKVEEMILLNASSLHSANLVQDAEGNNEAGPLPTFTSKRKGHALRQLVASLPLENQDSAKFDMTHLLRATKSFTGNSPCRSDGEGGWRLRGMTTSLTNYQVLGAAFMRKRETGSDEPRGGILADQMGLGKTVQSLAVIVNGMPRENDPNTTTLIVAPPALCSQWYDEIFKHCNKKAVGSVLKHFGGKKLETNDTADAFNAFNIVLTTYTEINRSYPKGEPPVEAVTAEEKSRWWKIHYEKHKGPFHRTTWHRIILDEAQAIKNYLSRTSTACRTLKAQHKWALSGTPITNTVQELYPYFKFLGVPHTGSYKIFRRNFYGGNDPAKVRRLNAMLSKFMIRRTHADRLFGMPLIQLPNAHEQIHWLKFNDFERKVYNIVKDRMVKKVQQWAKTDSLNKNYANIFVMMLRLRQLTCHILLLEGVMRDVLELEDFEHLSKLAEEEMNPKVQDEKTQCLIMLRKTLAEQAKQASQRKNNECPAIGEDPDEAMFEIQDPNMEGTGAGNHGLEYDFREYVAALKEKQKWEEVHERTQCALCSQPPVDPQLAQCFHVHCKSCIDQLQWVAASRNIDQATCARCSVPFQNIRGLLTDYMNGTVSSPEGGKSTDAEGGKKGKGKGKKRSRKPALADNDEDRSISSLIDLRGAILPSPKTIAVKAAILNWFTADPSTKVIIYTQFIPMIKILAKVCEIEGWTAIRYFGGMSFDARDDAIREFREHPTGCILLASLRCGGLGLNLTAASHVICIDPWWNNSIDQQAFGRVFRYGQTKETHFLRLVVGGSIDDSMMKMQTRKQMEIDQVLESRSKKQLSVAELVKLFCPGPEGEGADDFLFVDDQEIIPNHEGLSDNEEMLDSV